MDVAILADFVPEQRERKNLNKFYRIHIICMGNEISGATHVWLPFGDTSRHIHSERKEKRCADFPQLTEDHNETNQKEKKRNKNTGEYYVRTYYTLK